MKRITILSLICIASLAGIYKVYVIMKQDPHQQNHLAKEKSPYLLQHKDNPIWWYTWGEEALSEAKKQHKPIFLSIGYSTCHWCHVMEHESFETQKVADVLNKNFISIKVDREERPDLDALYMNAVQLITGRGGWPLSAWLTPDGRPFYGGTYYPQAQFIDLLGKISKTWNESNDTILEQGDRLKEHIQKYNESKGPLSSLKLEDDILVKFYQQMSSRFDSSKGGFGAAPKFPQTMSLMALLRLSRRYKDSNVEKMVDKTLEEMSRRGMYDHLNGGFHRYSTDTNWLVPHFEKMLYDNALLSLTLLEAYQVNNKAEYKYIIEDTLDYILAEMTHPEGGFYSAQDADSLDPEAGHKEEGYFAVWDYKELNSILSAEELVSLGKVFDISPAGNFEGKNILTLRVGVSSEQKKTVVEILKALKAVRASRPQPHLDDKIVVAWNGLMIGAMARASRILNQEKYYEAARKALNFLLSKTLKKDGLKRRWRDGEARYPGYSDDYALLIFALLEVYQIDFSSRWIDQAVALQKEMDARFWDKTGFGYFRDDGSDKSLILRLKSEHDGVRPSSNSVAAYNLLRLHDLTYNAQYKEQAEKIFNSFSKRLGEAPSSLPFMLIAFDYYSDVSKEVAIVANPEDPVAKKIIQTLTQSFQPNKVLAVGVGGVPLLKDKTQIDGEPTIYICENKTCRLPTTDVKKALELMGGFKKI